MNLRYPLLRMFAAGVLPTQPSFAATDQEAVAAKVEAFRQAQVAASADALNALILPELNYSHSEGRVEDCAQFIANATSGKSSFLSLEYREPAISIVGNSAVVRFHWVAQQRMAADGGKMSTNLHILMVWQKQNADWKLLARSATKI